MRPKAGLLLATVLLVGFTPMASADGLGDAFQAALNRIKSRQSGKTERSVSDLKATEIRTMADYRAERLAKVEAFSAAIEPLLDRIAAGPIKARIDDERSGAGLDGGYGHVFPTILRSATVSIGRTDYSVLLDQPNDVKTGDSIKRLEVNGPEGERFALTTELPPGGDLLARGLDVLLEYRDAAGKQERLSTNMDNLDQPASDLAKRIVRELAAPIAKAMAVAGERR